MSNSKSRLAALVPEGRNLAFLVAAAFVVWSSGAGFTLRFSGTAQNIKQIPAIADSVAALRTDLENHSGIVGHAGMVDIVASLDSIINDRFDRLQCLMSLQLEGADMTPLQVEDACPAGRR